LKTIVKQAVRLPQPSNLCLGFKDDHRRDFMASKVAEPHNRLSFVLAHFEPDRILKLGLFGFASCDAKNRFIFIILFAN
jgi:hypothetical protein